MPSLFTADFAGQPYRSKHAFGTTYLEHRAALELDEPAWHDLAACARDIGILFFATAFDIPSADFLVGLGVPALKIGSGDALNWPLLDHAATLGVPLLVSTGGLSWNDLDATAQRLADRAAQFALLQCTSTYPSPPEELDLSVIPVMRQRYPETVIGYSGHEQGIIPSLAAAALGAAIIERHFTTDNSLRGSDQRYSLTPGTMAELIQGASLVRRSLGSRVKHRHRSEQPALHKLGKKLVAATDLPAGHILSHTDLAVRSPADGLSPHMLDQVVGTRLLRPLKRDEALAIHVNVAGTLLTVSAFGGPMASAGRGSVILIGSQYAIVSPRPQMYNHLSDAGHSFIKNPAYGASKAAVANIARYFAAHWGPKGVRVNALSPGGVRSGQDHEFQRKFANEVPLGRMLEADELEGPLLFLASDASSYVTGTHLIIDGGYTAW